jgi:enoyl-CoA hydratase/carnithine racemase
MSDVLTERAGTVLRVTTNRPTKKNAMTSAMYLELAEAFKTAAADDGIHAVLWDAAGDSFSAGNDIEDFLKNPPGGQGESPQVTLMKALLALDKPLVAAVQGAAIGGGTTLLTFCDVVIAGESAKFRTPFVDLGLVPEFGSSWSLPARVGDLRAAEMILLGAPVDARRAEAIGLVSRVVPDASLLAAATEAAKALAEKPAGAVQTCKRLLKRRAREAAEQAFRFEGEEFAKRVRSDEVRAIFSAFLEKHAPRPKPQA